jgi:glycosyltransferase involved in cell wall biosynthesis
MSKVKILYIHQDGLITGSAISLRNFLSAINRDKYEPIMLLAEEGPARQLYEDIGIKVHVHTFIRFWTFPGPNYYSPSSLKQFKAFWPNKELVSLVKKINPDVIHVNDKAAMAAGVNLKKLGKPIVQHSRSSYSITASRLNKWVNASTIKNYSDFIVAISEDEVEGFEKFKNLAVINNTVDMEQVRQALTKRENTRIELGLEANKIAIGMVGDISAKKGIWNFLDMAVALVKKFPQLPLKFLAVGRVQTTGNTVFNDGTTIAISPEKYIAEFIEKNNLTDKITLTGFRKDALAVMASLDILIVANTNGVMGRQPIEAQALGVPVVVTQGHSNNSTILLNNFAGLVISNPAKTDELLSAVESLINDPAKRAEFGKNGQDYANKKFVPATNMRRIEEIYETLLKSRN